MLFKDVRITQIVFLSLFLDSKILERLDDFSAPTSVEYFDEDPGFKPRRDRFFQTRETVESFRESVPPRPLRDLGVTVEEQFSVGEYDILILSAKESNGLETWLI